MAKDNELREVALKRFARSEKAIKTLSTNQDTITKNQDTIANAIKTDREQLPVTVQRITKEAVKPVDERLTRFLGLNEFKNLELELEQRQKLLKGIIIAACAEELRKLYAEYRAEFLAIHEIFHGAEDRLAEQFMKESEPLEAERVKRSHAYRKVEAKLGKPMTIAQARATEEKVKRALAAYRRWCDSVYQPKIDKLIAAQTTAIDEAKQTFAEAAASAYARYIELYNAEVKQWNEIAEALLDLQFAFGGLMLADTSIAKTKAHGELFEIRKGFLEIRDGILSAADGAEFESLLSAEIEDLLIAAMDAAIKSDWHNAWQGFDAVVAKVGSATGATPDGPGPLIPSDIPVRKFDQVTACVEDGDRNILRVRSVQQKESV